MIGCNICSDKHIGKRKLARGMNSAATETVTETDAVLEGKGERKEINELGNGKHSLVTLNDTAQQVILCMSIGMKDVLAPQKTEPDRL